MRPAACARQHPCQQDDTQVSARSRANPEVAGDLALPLAVVLLQQRLLAVAATVHSTQLVHDFKNAKQWLSASQCSWLGHVKEATAVATAL